ncbi:MAG TPA: hypothetical protein VN019_10755 [Oxalicibacterium sp.]|nr:hypothetical protein [Oxalicibacterium sp.]
MKTEQQDFDEPEIEPSTMAFRIKKYVSEHPGCLTSDIVRDTGILVNTVRGTLLRLRESGHVKKTFKNEWNGDKNKGEPAARWWIGIDEGVTLKERKDGAPRQRTVKTWKKQSVQHDPIAVLLFGIRSKDQQGGLIT